MTIIYAFLFLFADITLATLMQHPLTEMLTWFYILLLVRHDTTVSTLTYLWPLLTIQSFMFWGIPGLELLYLIPVTAIGLFLKPRLHESIIVPLLLASLCMSIHYVFIDWCLFGLSPLKDYTIRKIFINLGIVMCMSLKIYWRGTLGSRL